MSCSVGMVLSCGKDHTLKLVDMRSFQIKHTMRANGFSVGNTWCSATISADERHVASGSVDGQVFIWEVQFPPFYTKFRIDFLAISSYKFKLIVYSHLSPQRELYKKFMYSQEACKKPVVNLIWASWNKAHYGEK